LNLVRKLSSSDCYLHFFVLHRLDYKFLWTMYYVLLCLFGGGIISGIDGIAGSSW
jgi:hypothetical protein